MHSFGESSTQPSTPCSASGECGGNRSTSAEDGRVACGFLAPRLFQISGGTGGLGNGINHDAIRLNYFSRIKTELLNLSDTFFTSRDSNVVRGK